MPLAPGPHYMFFCLFNECQTEAERKIVSKGTYTQNYVNVIGFEPTHNIYEEYSTSQEQITGLEMYTDSFAPERSGSFHRCHIAHPFSFGR